MDYFVELERRIHTMERRIENTVRYAQVSERRYNSTNGYFEVKVQDGDFTSDWTPWNDGSSGQNVSFSTSPATGDQVVMFSPSGDPSIGFVMPGPSYQSRSDNNPNQMDQARLKVGSSVMTFKNGEIDIETSGKITFKVGGSTVTMEPGKVTIKSDKIVTDGNTHLGSEDGVPSSKQGTIDSAGHAEVANLATKVFVT